MSMMWKDPREELMPLRDAVNRLFEDSFVWPGRLEVFAGRTFSVDVYETEDQQGYVVEAFLPEVKPEEVQITAADDTLTIRVVRKMEEEKRTYVHRERYEGEMTRTIALPTQIQPEKVQATYENGLLKLLVPKVEGVKMLSVEEAAQRAWTGVDKFEELINQFNNTNGLRNDARRAEIGSHYISLLAATYGIAAPTDIAAQVESGSN